MGFWLSIVNKTKQKKFQNKKQKHLTHASRSSVGEEKLSDCHMLLSDMFKSLYDMPSVFLPLILWKYASPNTTGVPKQSKS
jgi:hypothetical protein